MKDVCNQIFCVVDYRNLAKSIFLSDIVAVVIVILGIADCSLDFYIQSMLLFADFSVGRWIFRSDLMMLFSLPDPLVIRYMSMDRVLLVGHDVDDLHLASLS